MALMQRSDAPNVETLFHDEASLILSDNPAVVHSWSRERGGWTLSIPKQIPGGFDVIVWTEARGLIVGAGTGAHEHFDIDEYTVQGAVSHALGLIRDLLSVSTRVREVRAGAVPYRWHIEVLDRGTWRTETTTVTFPLMFWARRSERFYQNETLPPRESPLVIPISEGS